MGVSMPVYGNCISCGFPILVKSPNPVNCPMCSTANQPNPISFAPLAAIGLPVVLGIATFLIAAIGKSSVKKAAAFTAGYVAEPAIDYGAKWAKEKLKGKEGR